MVRTLYNLSDLRDSRFGRPPPRHGLLLLWWFAHECVRDVDANGRVIAQCDPTNGAFGFHRFYNRERLLPYSDYLYFEVGNLHITDSLPRYVTENYTGNSDSSNTDRIIVSFDSRLDRFDSIYVTQHSSLLKFDQNHTFRISSDLMKQIISLSRREFLKDPNSPKPSVSPAYVSIEMPNEGRVQERPSHRYQPEQNNTCLESCCALIRLFFVLLLIIVAIIFFFAKMK